MRLSTGPGKLYSGCRGEMRYATKHVHRAVNVSETRYVVCPSVAKRLPSGRRKMAYRRTSSSYDAARVAAAMSPWTICPRRHRNNAYRFIDGSVAVQASYTQTRLDLWHRPIMLQKSLCSSWYAYDGRRIARRHGKDRTRLRYMVHDAVHNKRRSQGTDAANKSRDPAERQSRV